MIGQSANTDDRGYAVPHPRPLSRKREREEKQNDPTMRESPGSLSPGGERVAARGRALRNAMHVCKCEISWD